MRINKNLPVLIATGLAVLTATQAMARPDTRYMSCAAAVSLVQQNGAVILSTGPHTYDKFVKNHAYCNINEIPRRKFAPTTDNRRCRVGYVCKNKLDFHD